MGLDEEIRGLDSDRNVQSRCLSGLSRLEPCASVCGHFSYLKQVDFNLHAHLYFDQLIEDLNLLPSPTTAAFPATGRWVSSSVRP